MAKQDRDKSQDSGKEQEKDRGSSREDRKSYHDSDSEKFSEGDRGDTSTRVSDTHEPPDPPSEKK